MARAKRPAPPAPDAADEQRPDDHPERLAAALGLEFRDPDLLRLALTHRSVLHDWNAAAPGADPPPVSRRSNERLEFLGDAVLGYVVADLLYHRFPEAPEGELTAQRVSLVRAERLVGWAREIGLADYLYLGQGEKVTEHARDRMLAGAFEALIGAVLEDRGLREARRFIRRFVEPDLPTALAGLHEANPKGRLQELLQEAYRVPPVYETLVAEGPAHDRTFTVEVSIEGRQLAVGTGRSKREAEQAAASAALAELDPAAHPPPRPAAPKRRRRGAAPPE